MAPRAPAAGRRRAPRRARAPRGRPTAAPPPRPPRRRRRAEAEEGEAGEVGGDGEAAGARGRTLRLEFVCITAQDLLAVKTDDARPSLLTHLLEDDSGLELPAAAAAALTPRSSGETIVNLLPARPYLWAQQLGAAADDAAANGGGGLPPSIAALQFFGRVMSALRERSHARDVLERWLTRLATADTAPLPDVAAPPAPNSAAALGAPRVEGAGRGRGGRRRDAAAGGRVARDGRRCFVGEVTRPRAPTPPALSPPLPPHLTTTSTESHPRLHHASGGARRARARRHRPNLRRLPARAAARRARVGGAAGARARAARRRGCARSPTRGRCGWRRRTRRRRATTTWC